MFINSETLWTHLLSKSIDCHLATEEHLCISLGSTGGVCELNFPKYGKGNLQIYNSNPDLQKPYGKEKKEEPRKGKGIKQE